ncbi:MAG: membrane-bound lytic murein transglycosylase MltF, partial [Gammaproteobacteria bacterium]|nr:membrane-bound lytic murein transglycosylase MltF [Gammaproteobacteria bacterium]
VVCRRGNDIPRNIQGLEAVKLLVSTDTSYVETLQNLQTEIPSLNWMANKEFDTEQLLEKVWKNELDCTVADSNIIAINRRYFPELVVAFDLSEPEPISWLLPKDAGDIQEKLNQWYLDIEQRGFLTEIIERYYGFVDLFDYVDIRKFQKRVEHRLPRYQEHFIQAAKQYKIHWTLLAAQSYQESHWRPKAKSPTGVRGMMMLTLPTAREMGVKSRLNARESIYGGARYLAKLRRRIPDSVIEPDRTWMALAAYNVGMGHIYDARSLTKELGKNPDRWSDLQETLPLLSQKQYYKKTKHGYARGSEPVSYVNRIRDFKDLLDQSMSVTPVRNDNP